MCVLFIPVVSLFYNGTTCPDNDNRYIGEYHIPKHIQYVFNPALLIFVVLLNPAADMALSTAVVEV